MNTGRITITLALFAALAACQANQSEQGDAPPDPDPRPSATPSAAPTEQVSILRPDVEAEQQAPVVEVEPLEATIGFPEGGSELDDDAVAALRDVLASPQLELGGPITLGGHSDTGGSDAVNLRASTARAEAVRDWLIEEGVTEERIEVIAFGEQNPVQPNALPDGSPNEEGRAANRRVEISIAVSRAEASGESTEAGD